MIVDDDIYGVVDILIGAIIGWQATREWDNADG